MTIAVAWLAACFLALYLPPSLAVISRLRSDNRFWREEWRKTHSKLLEECVEKQRLFVALAEEIAKGEERAHR